MFYIWLQKKNCEEMSEVLISSFLLSHVSDAQVAHQKWAICSGRSEEMSEWAIRSKKFG